MRLRYAVPTALGGAGAAYILRGRSRHLRWGATDQEFHEPTAPDVNNQFTTMAASGADVLLIETSGTFCTQAMAEVEKNTAWNPVVILSGTCASLSQFFQPLIDQGLRTRVAWMREVGLEDPLLP